MTDEAWISEFVDANLKLTTVNAPYWSALREGRLTFQACSCAMRWLPPRSECPRCLGTDWKWVDAEGAGTLVSWVIYRVAYNPALKERLPYNVAIVELKEGPRLITNILESPDGRGLFAGAPVRFDVARSQRHGRAQFALIAPAPANRPGD